MDCGATGLNGFIDFTGSWSGNSLDVKLNYRSQWIFVDEVQFQGTAAPEHSSALLLLGSGMMFLLQRRHQFRTHERNA